MSFGTSQNDPAELAVQLRLCDGAQRNLAAVAISATDCMVRGEVSDIEPGERVLIRIQGLAPLSATVMWAGGDRAVISFERALYEPVLQHLHQLRAA